MPFKDHFQTLRVPHRATSLQIQKAYRERLKFFHPDYFEGDPARHAIAELETRSLNEAFEAVGAPEAREVYLREWERHQNPQRALPQRAASVAGDADARAELDAARSQIRELQVLLEQRERELKAASIGVRQGQERLKSLQRSVENHQETQRELEERLRERTVELEAARGRAESAQTRIRQLGSARMVEEAAASTGREGEPNAIMTITTYSRELDSATGTGHAGDSSTQEEMLAKAAAEILALRERVRSAEAALRAKSRDDPAAGPTGAATSSDAQREELQALRVALSERTLAMHNARRTILELQERLHLLEGREIAASVVEAPELRGWLDRASYGLDARHGALMVIVLLLAVFSVGFALITVMAPSLLAGLRPGP